MWSDAIISSKYVTTHSQYAVYCSTESIARVLPLMSQFQNCDKTKNTKTFHQKKNMASKFLRVRKKDGDDTLCLLFANLLAVAVELVTLNRSFAKS